MTTEGKAKGILGALRSGDVAGALTRYADLALAGLVVCIVGMMIVPLPTAVLDLLISANIAIAVTLLLVAIYVSDALKIATFPTLLLITTLFRLAIEVSATRLILLRADGGEVIEAFGEFVVQGNLVVGAVIFLILTMVQFIVIAKGSERVAEVAARFTLDAMPGKQMSIDAELRAGHIDHTEARRRRAALARESQLFGSMDGAMKFVKGDAIAGMIILLVNVIGGLLIGTFQRGMELGLAARTYTVLTIGEGLVSQIPALIISTAAGIIVTRVASEEEEGQLGRDIGRQILRQPRAIAITGALLLLLAIVPGLPLLPFLLLGTAFAFVAWRLMKAGAARPASLSQKDGPPVAAAATAPQRGAAEAMPPVPTPVAVEVGADLMQTLGPGGGRLFTEIVPALRERLFAETGITLPAVRLRSSPDLAEGRYVLRLNDVPMANGRVQLGARFVPGELDVLHAAGLAGTAADGPDGGAGMWITGDAAVPARHQALSPEEVVAAHLRVLFRRYGFELIGIQEAQHMLDALEKTHPALVREVVPKVVSPKLVADVLRRLAEEGVSLRTLPEILGALAEWAPLERDPVVLTEHVRSALRRHITHRHSTPHGVLPVYLLDPMIEEAVGEAIHRTATGSYLALEPDISASILRAVDRTLGSMPRDGSDPVLLTTPEIRRYVRRLVETQFPRLAVLSYQDLAPEAQIQPLARISVTGA